MSVEQDLAGKLLTEAEPKGVSSGKSDVADYLELRRTNDALRQAGVTWLLATFIDAVAPHMRMRPGLRIDRTEVHSFLYESTTMIGSLLEMRHGVRRLTVEAGWVRRPGDGIMRDGALAVAYVEHFGLPKAGQSLKLKASAESTIWVDEEGVPATSATVTPHLELFLEL
jgi:hypothetical protein